MKFLYTIIKDLVLFAVLVLGVVLVWGMFHPAKPTVTSGTSAIVRLAARAIPVFIPHITINPTGFTASDMAAAISAALHAKTATQISAKTTMTSGATPMPVPAYNSKSSLTSTDQSVIYNITYGSAYNADVAYGKTQSIKTEVTISQVPVEVSRFGEGYVLGSKKSGGFTLQYNVPITGLVSFSVGAVLGKHVTPTVGANYRINALRVGPVYDPITHSPGVAITYSI